LPTKVVADKEAERFKYEAEVLKFIGLVPVAIGGCSIWDYRPCTDQEDAPHYIPNGFTTAPMLSQSESHRDAVDLPGQNDAGKTPLPSYV
jgi:hypothetical protein